MGLFIQDAKGRGYQGAVNDRNELMTYAYTVDYIRSVAHGAGEAYSAPFTQTPSADGGCIFYLKNTADIDLVVPRIRFAVASDQIIDLRLGLTGTASNGTAITPVNRNSGSGNEADCTCQQGTGITELTSGSIVDVLTFTKGNVQDISYCSGLILPKNHALGLFCNSAGVNVVGNVTMYFSDEVS